MKKTIIILILAPLILTSCNLPETRCIKWKNTVEFTVIKDGWFDDVYKIKFDDGSMASSYNYVPDRLCLETELVNPTPHE